MNRLRRLSPLIIYLGMLNFVLFFLFTLLLGNSLYGKVEAGQYYLGNHGAYTEVIYPIYRFSWIQGVLFFASLPLIIIALLIYWAGAGSERDDEVMHAAHLGRTFDIVEGFFSLLFDAWRKPDLEFFTRLTPSKCIQELLTLPDWIVRDSLKKRPFDLTWGDQHFEVSRYAWDAWHGWGTPIVLHGRFHSTPHGTYLKAWYRWSAANLLFLSLFAISGAMFSLSGLAWLFVKVWGANQAAIIDFLASIWPIWSIISTVIGPLLLIAFSGWWGSHRRSEFANLVKEALATDS